MSTVNKALRGLSDLSIFTVIQNDEEDYKVGQRIRIYGAQELTSQKEVSEWEIYADDGIYDTGADWKGNTFTLTLAGLPNEHRNYFEGGMYNPTADEYTFSIDNEAPEIALSFASSTGGNTKELTKVYSAKCTKVSFSHKTKGDSNSVVPVTIEGRFMQRKLDKAVFTKKEIEGNNISWLNTIE